MYVDLPLISSYIPYIVDPWYAWQLLAPAKIVILNHEHCHHPLCTDRVLPLR